MTSRALLLGGTAEARDLAAVLAPRRDVEVISSLAGRVSDPALPAGTVRIGGFGGAEGLYRWLTGERIDVVIDATHPFATGISASAASACGRSGIPLLRLCRPPWLPGPGDDWIQVPAVADVPAALGEAGRVFLTIGRQGLPVFAGCDRHWFLVRTVDPPVDAVPPRMQLVLDRGPFTVEGETALLRTNRIDLVVTKNSGGPMTAAKLAACRQLGVPVLMIARPPTATSAVAEVSTVAEAASRLDRVITMRGTDGG